MSLTFEVTINVYLSDLGLYHVEIWNGEDLIKTYMNDSRLRDNNEWGSCYKF